jgi:hypothetical protein
MHVVVGVVTDLYMITVSIGYRLSCMRILVNILIFWKKLDPSSLCKAGISLLVVLENLAQYS